MTKSDLIDRIAEKLKLLRGKAEEVVNMVFDSMEHSLKNGERIEIRGFGSFEIRHYKAYVKAETRAPETRWPCSPSACLLQGWQGAQGAGQRRPRDSQPDDEHRHGRVNVVLAVAGGVAGLLVLLDRPRALGEEFCAEPHA